jgi:hypothetical protein
MHHVCDFPILGVLRTITSKSIRYASIKIIHGDAIIPVCTQYPMTKPVAMRLKKICAAAKFLGLSIPDSFAISAEEWQPTLPNLKPASTFQHNS